MIMIMNMNMNMNYSLEDIHKDNINQAYNPENNKVDDEEEYGCYSPGLPLLDGPGMGPGRP